MVFRVVPRIVALRLFALVLLLSAANIVALYFYFFRGGYGRPGEYFDVGVEGNIPTLYSVLVILAGAVITWLQGIESRSSRDGLHRYWFGLCAIMAFLAVDEFVQIHELVSNMMEWLITPTGLLYFLWVVPYGLAVVVISVVYLWFLARLPTSTARRLVAAGLIFLAGALGVEMLSAQVGQTFGTDSLRYSVLYSIEEFLEMSGIVVFVYAVLSHGSDDGGEWSVRIQRGG